jgi:DNA-binding beta-propeller fold protein YncE
MKKSIVFISFFIATTCVFLTAQAEQLKYQSSDISGEFNYPSDIVVIPGKDKAYISSKSNSCIYIIDLEIPAISGTIVFPDIAGEIQLTELLYNPVYHSVYALDWANSRMFIIDETSDTLLDPPVIVGGFPQNLIVSPDGQSIFVCANQKDEIVMINSQTNLVQDRIYIGEDADPYGMAIARDKLYVAGRFSCKVYIIDIQKKTEINRIKVTQSPYDVVARTDGAFVYVSHDTPSGEISIIDTSTDQYISSITIRNDHETSYKNSKGLLIHENQLFIANFGDQSISVIDTQLNQQINFCHPLFSGENYPEKLAMSDDAANLYIVHPVSDHVSVLELPPEKPTFSKGQDIQVKNCMTEQRIAHWATNIYTGDNESYEFVCTTNNESFFSRLPDISTDGTLTFQPSPHSEGDALVTVVLKRNVQGIEQCHTSDPITFTIHIVSCDPTLTLSKTGSGEIEINDHIRVLPPYAQQFDKGNQIKLFAHPYDTNWRFSYWHINGNETSTANPLFIEMTSDFHIKAIFVEQLPVQMDITGNCSIEVDHIPHSLPWQEMFTAGATVSLYVADNFSHWSGDFSGTNNPISIQINYQNIHLIANCHTESSASYYLKKGFNLVALSLIPENSSLLNVFPQTKVAYAYENGQYTRAYTLTPGKAYWIEMPSTRSCLVSGTRFSRYQKKLSRGWQMIGGIDETKSIKSIPDNCVQTIYEYSDGEYKQCSLIEPQKGYWIYLIQDCEIIIE